MVGRFLAVGPILLRIAENVGCPRDHFDLDLRDLVRLDVVFLHAFHHRRQRRVTQRFNWKALHAAIDDLVVVLGRLRRDKK